MNYKHVFVLCLVSVWLVAGYALSAENGLMGHWRLDEGEGAVVHDSSGNNNQGTLHDATWNKGKLGTALCFDGQKSWVHVPHSDSLVPKNNQVSILVWCSPGKMSSAIHHLLAKWGNYYLRFTGPDHLAFAVYEHGEERICGAHFKFQPGTWYYLAATYDGQSLSLYIDGDLVMTQLPCPPVQMDLDDKHDLHLGSASWGVAEFYDGRLGEVKIYNRAMTQNEILKAGGTEIKPKLLAVLKQELPATQEGLRMVDVPARGKTQRDLADCYRDFERLRARFGKIEQALSREEALSTEEVCLLCQENRVVLKEVEDLAYRFGLEALFLEK